MEEILMSRINVDVTGDTKGNISVNGDTKKNTKITISIGSVVIISVMVVFVWLFISNDLEKRIIGTWNIVEQQQIFVSFDKNNIFTASNGSDYFDGSYIFLNEDTIQINVNYLWGNFILSGQISINGNKMTIKNIKDPDDILGVDDTIITLIRTKK